MVWTKTKAKVKTETTTINNSTGKYVLEMGFIRFAHNNTVTVGAKYDRLFW